MSSHYTRSVTNGIVSFNVTPAPYPIGYTNYIAFAAGLGVIWLSTYPFAVHDFRLVGWILLIFGFVMVVPTAIKIAMGVAKNKERSPHVISVSAKELVAGGERIETSSVKEIVVGHDEGGKASARQYEASPAGIGAQIGTNARLRVEASQSHVCFQVLARLSGESRLRLVSNGLTEQTARALVSDLTDEVRKHGGIGS